MNIIRVLLNIPSLVLSYSKFLPDINGLQDVLQYVILSQSYKNKEDQIEVVRALLALPIERGIKPGTIVNKGLFYAVDNKNVEIVRMLLELPLERGVLIYPHIVLKAMRRNNTKIILMFLNLKEPRAIKDTNLLQEMKQTARENGNYEILEKLIWMSPIQAID